MSSAAAISVLFADITGSTRLYEQHGDEAARTTVAQCIEVLTGVLEEFNGRLVKTIGDEVMCVFTDPAKAVMAANEMQLAVRAAGEANLFLTGPLQIKIGLHHGTAVEQTHEVLGEASITAQQVIQHAQADQILTSRNTIEVLPPELRHSRPFDTVTAEGRPGNLEIVELIWEVSDLTQMAETQAIKPLPGHTRLVLSYRGQTEELGDARPRFTLGRTDDNDLMVATMLASRRHAEIEYRKGRFHLRDMSSNGTFLVTEGGEIAHMRGESVQLHGSGQICLGGPPDANQDGLVDFECE